MSSVGLVRSRCVSAVSVGRRDMWLEHRAVTDGRRKVRNCWVCANGGMR